MICREILEKNSIGHLCDKCYSFVLRNNLCARCGRPYNIGDQYCVYCNKDEETVIEQIVPLFLYDEKFKKAVLRWKYSGLRKYAKGYADLFANDLCIIDKLNIEGLIPVPLAPRRARKRGFNQALDLTNEISKLTGAPVYDVLKRVKETKAQSQCNKKERLVNIKGSIVMKTDISALDIKNIAIVDDIYTTGATIKECIGALNRQNSIAGKKIYVLTVCIGI